ncbi:MAG: hypothetical protein MMC33_005991 [Icmadophila ericetorum]|nr:hypothetical protein [Icmadophila ericetorum]
MMQRPEVQRSVRLHQANLTRISHEHGVPIEKLQVRTKDTFMVISRTHRQRYYKVNETGEMVEVFYQIDETGHVREVVREARPYTDVNVKSKGRADSLSDASLNEWVSIPDGFEQDGSIYNSPYQAPTNPGYRVDQEMDRGQNESLQLLPYAPGRQARAHVQAPQLPPAATRATATSLQQPAVGEDSASKYARPSQRPVSASIAWS